MPYDSVYSEKRPPGTLRTAWRKFYSDASAMVGLYGCAGLAVLCIFGGWFAPYGIDQQFLGYQLLPPSWSRYGEVSFFLGTDDLGRDVLSRLLSGAAPTVGGAFVVTLAATICGLVLGTFAGATHGLRSAVLNHILDTLLAIPSLLLAIIVVAFAGPSLSHAMFAVWLALLPRMVRSIYSMVHDELEKEYVIAARLDGASTLNILWFAVMPNITAGLVTEGVDGFLYKDDDPQQLADKLTWAIEHPEALAAMHDSCRRLYEQQFSNESYVATLTRLVKELTDGNE